MTNNNGAVASLFADRWIDVTFDMKDTAGIDEELHQKKLVWGCLQRK